MASLCNRSKDAGLLDIQGCSRESRGGGAQVLKRLPNLKKLDGAPVEVEEREAALAARA